jgi:hypothetical protein
MFLNINANVTNWNGEGNECSLVSMAAAAAPAAFKLLIGTDAIGSEHSYALTQPSGQCSSS